MLQKRVRCLFRVTLGNIFVRTFYQYLETERILEQLESKKINKFLLLIYTCSAVAQQQDAITLKPAVCVQALVKVWKRQSKRIHIQLGNLSE